ncbi:uncharacterized protein LOC133842048 isoform X3 [Drosophila sulfurigaster albostrigata]|uniref:Uncharacterized protein LOC117569416 isoform X5 n=1 Tax=Drosophila albomicans TaxID=7291 RepID=A0A6P8X3Y9_DROAB|nr:uncharacterized protein LOC117569416 isoform X5 [Drosophila albomicans]XP_060655015.1 uncharacterized protein LOC132790494 isoform X5 [Drosophila nasuta]XP_062130931.1 uncharacterized protein LOC133842048 isoform X3 [Drosophila sulfurigaster albostrigata]
MNLMFRKNFREGASKSGGGGGKLQSKANRTKRSRDMGLVQQPEEIHYRTHLFFSPNRPGYDVGEERCSALSGIPGTPTTATSFTLPSNPYEVDLPQPLVDRSVSLMRWNSTSGSGSGNFGGGGNAGTTRAEPISLATLDRDCFIIPVHSVDRFLPAGIPLPALNAEGKATSPLSVLEVSDPKLCILVHLMSPLEAIDPVMESPLSHPLLKQRAIAAELLTEVQQANTAVGGMILANMEKSSEFPFISYYLINTMQTDPSNFYSSLRVSSLSKFEPKTLKYTAAHTLDLYSEVAAICRPPLVLPSNEAGSFKKSQTSATGYIISVFKVFEGDDGERFEKNWLYWTGARMLYRYLPRAAGLRRIALHKSTSQKGDKMYLLVCECADLLKDISLAAFLIPALRARLCGYTGLYRPIQTF